MKQFVLKVNVLRAVLHFLPMSMRGPCSCIPQPAAAASSPPPLGVAREAAARGRCISAGIGNFDGNLAPEQVVYEIEGRNPSTGKRLVGGRVERCSCREQHVFLRQHMQQDE